MRRWGIYIVLILLVGCRCPECVVTGTDTETTVTVHTHDSSLVVPPDSAQMKLLLRCDSTNNVLIDQIATADGERIKMQLRLEQLATGGAAVATIDCNEDSLKQIIQWQDSVIKSTTTKTVVRIEKQKDFVYYCGWIFIAAVILAIIAAIVGVVLKFVK